MEQKYNGWSNWETWNLFIWLNDNEGFYNWYCDQGKKLGKDEVIQLVCDMWPQGTPDMENGISEMFKVNWNEIVEAVNEWLE